VKFFFTFYLQFAIKIEMNVFKVSIETPMPNTNGPICMNNKYVTLRVWVGGSRETWPSVTKWVGWVRNGHFWRVVFMQWPLRRLKSNVHLTPTEVEPEEL